MKHLSSYFFCLFFCFFLQNTAAQQSLKNKIGDSLSVTANRQQYVGKVTVKTLNINAKTKTVTIATNANLGYLNFREETVEQIYAAIRRALPSGYRQYNVRCRVPPGCLIEHLVPNLFRSKNEDNSRRFKPHKPHKPLVSKSSQPYEITHGLQARHLALWNSHGWHYNQSLARWQWQRARLLQTVEDLYTATYVLPFLVPMLENAGATVLLPRERDTQTQEMIADNDNADNSYTEKNGKHSWKHGGTGFANSKTIYVQGENPFATGSFRSVETTSDESETSLATWQPDFPEAGRYAVYVSYKTLRNSTSEALYTVYHSGGETQFSINQNLGGGTWIYLGTFDFEKGKSPQGRLTLSNFNHEHGKTVTADAVKFGGGMGNIGRMPSDSIIQRMTAQALADSLPAPEFSPQTGGYPRYAEAARYWLQWAGMPDTVYSRSEGTDDYRDDLQARSAWVNFLTKNLRLPVDLTLAFHSDAGNTQNDSIIGTLTICSTKKGKNTTYPNGVSRMAGRDLAEIVSTQIADDMRKLYTPRWTNRGVWDRSYNEAREPDLPTVLLEAHSHQNFADMNYGLDPEFRFHFSRAVYKGILKYMQSVHGHELIAQPLPVHSFSAVFEGDDEVKLQWLPTADPLDSACVAKKYVVYTRMDDGGFDNGILVSSDNHKQKIEKDRIYSFKVTAVNEGGESFPSEILSVCRSSKSANTMLIINGFDRISAPYSFVSADSTLAGFRNEEDAGVPYISDIAFVGGQYEFRQSIPWVTDDDPGFGASYAGNEGKPVAGNTFDYPFLHGKSIQRAGYSFVSCSRDAVVAGFVKLNNYKYVDLILGKQKEILTGHLRQTPKYQSFPKEFQQKIENYCTIGGKLFVSGSFVASDASTDKKFLENTLKIRLLNTKADSTGKISIDELPATFFKKSTINYYNTPNGTSYHANTPDGIAPVDSKGKTFCRYAGSNTGAGVVYSGQHRVCTLGFPFEIIKEESARDRLMQSVLQFLSSPISN